MTCTTPFEAGKSAGPMLAYSTLAPPVVEKVKSAPNKVVAVPPSVRSPLPMESATTWYVKMFARFGNASNSSTVMPKMPTPLLMASSVGANTVNGPGPDNASLSPAESTAAAKSVWSGLAAMTSRTVPWLHPETMNVIAAAMSVKKCFINELVLGLVEQQNSQKKVRRP